MISCGAIDETYRNRDGPWRRVVDLASILTAGATGLQAYFYLSASNVHGAYICAHFIAISASFTLGNWLGKRRFIEKEQGEYKLSESKLHQVGAVLVDAGIAGSIASLVTGLATGNHAAVEGGKWGLLTLGPFRAGDISRVFDYRIKDGLAYTPEGLIGHAVDIFTRNAQP